jgi:hypothetical protein
MNNPNITRLVLLKTSLENDYKHTLYFNGSGSQRDYFLSRKVKDYDFTNLTYIRKDHSVKVPLVYDDVVGCNYVMYQNKSDTKWYYAFITDIRYISEGVSELILETDCIQSWLFAYTVRPSFVEREHVSDDTVGLHTYPEQVELGEYVVNHYEKDMKLTNLKCVMAATVVLDGTPESASILEMPGLAINGMFSGVNYSVYDHLDFNGGKPVSSMQLAIQQVTDKKGVDAIQSIFIAPEFLVSKLTAGTVDRSEEVTVYEHTVNKYYDSTGLNGYTPRNNKLFTYPYKHLRVSNGNSGEAIYKYEYFGHYDDNPTHPSADDCHFWIKGALCPGCSIRLIPQWYKGIHTNESEGLNAGKFPICNWSSDLFTNWMTQNGVNVMGSILNSTASIGAGVVSAGVGGAAMLNPATAGIGATMIAGGVGSTVGGITQIGSTIREVKNAEMQPPQAYGNINNGDVITSSYNNTFHYYDVSIKQEYAKIIDGYFDMFGYKVCMVKQPNTHHRSRYWYTKTIDVNIDGAIPNKDLQVIKNAYNNGITFWRNGNEIGDYSLSNEIKNIV